MQTENVNELKIDRTKLMTFKNYAKAYGFSVQRIYQLEKEKKLGKYFFWCADVQEYSKEPLYVDGVHYTAKMSRMLADNIAEQLLKSNLLTKDRG